MKPHARLCIALDDPREDELVRLLDVLTGEADMVKLGLTAFTALGPEWIGEKSSVAPLFLDLKLHDIPSQIEGAARAASRLGAAFLSVHAQGGREMVRAAVEGSGGRTQVLAVTILTSLSEQDLARLGLPQAPALALRLAEEALSGGAAGLVCSAREAPLLRREFASPAKGGPLLVVPGVGNNPDQARRAGVREAVEAGADVIVVGRAITRSDDPRAAAREVRRELNPE